MEGVKYFFRGSPDEINFKMFGFIHLILVAVALLGVYLIYENKNKLKRDDLSKLVKKTMAIILLSQQAILYLWYAVTGYSNITESLPLYNCRVAIICTALALLTDKQRYKNISVFWGIYGAVLSLIVVEGDPFSFPHYTMVSFFVGHILLLWGSFFILIVDEYTLSKDNLEPTLIFTNMYHLLLLIFDFYTGSNYDYLVEPPVFKNMFALVPQLVYSFVAILAFNLLILLFYFLASKLKTYSEGVFASSEL